ncbi:MAG: hypothetical protein JNN24_18795 [Hyphomicrobium zavarzinii]|uniref:hypothetical protein n=1 Tax=Hyphomicrobium zavarzinii TaxID=48292 RepID=UPI001A58D3CD|nr:hypothetical protein [Hyphomicrobium zavarzinii]MBL8847818.1 hypothetical protein [Hyphomicrobium zavarzinii]
MQTFRFTTTRSLLMAGASCLISTSAFGQQAAQPANEGGLPEVQVIQKKAPGAPKAATKKAPPPQAPAPVAQPEPVQDAPIESNSPYGAANSGGARARAENSPTSPINPSNILPGNLQNFSSAASRVDTAQMD